MSNVIKKIKIKKENGTFTDYIPIGAEAENINVDGESVKTKLNKTPYYYNNVADMKADESLKVGDMAVTLGYYEVNDGGGAEYNIIDTSVGLVDDGGSYHELDNGLWAELIIKDKINVKQFGAYGDGIHDDYQAIQTAINYGENKTIYFTDNCVFLIGTHLSTSAQHEKKQFLQLAPNTTIKASSTFTDEYVIRLGETGTMEGYSASNFITGIDGGTIDGNNIANGIISERTHLAHLTNINVINAREVGIKIAQANNASSDAWLENIYILGSDIGAQSGIGLWVDGYDNNILMVRTSKMHTGIKITGGGNYLKNCHPLYGANGENNQYYESSVAFHFTKDDIYFEQCYNDNFSTGWYQDGDIRWSSNQMFNYWYENYNYKHTWIKVNSSQHFFRGKLNGVFGAMPSNGNNRILIQENHVLEPISIGQREDNFGSISNISFNNTGALLNFYTDEAFTNNMLGVQDYTLFNLNYQFTKDTWYPFLFVANEINAKLEVKLSIGTAIEANLNLVVSSRYTSSGIKKMSAESLGVDIENIEIGSQDFIFNQDNTTRYLRVFYFKLLTSSNNFTNTTGGVNVSLQGGSLLNTKIIIPPRNINEHTKIWNMIANTVENPIVSYATINNVWTTQNNLRLTPKGNESYKTTHTIDTPTTRNSIMLTTHYDSYHFVYLLYTWGESLIKKELLEDSGSIGHEPTISWDSTNKVITISMTNTGIIKYVIL